MSALCPLTALLCVTALLTTGAAAENDLDCPEGWSPFGTRCFKFFASLMTWTQAEKRCQSHGAHLASIHSAEENAFAVSLITKANPNGKVTWIGGHDAVQESEWTWNDGSAWDYSNWAAGQPDNWRGNENFLTVNWPDTAMWNDAEETIPLNVLCAKDASATVVLIRGGVVYKCAPNIHT